MDKTRLAIACKENRESGYEIGVILKENYAPSSEKHLYRLDKPMPHTFLYNSVLILLINPLILIIDSYT